MPHLPDDDWEAFMQEKRSERLPLARNDIVSVNEGPHQGAEGWIVSLVESSPEPRYTVELCSGAGDLYLKLSEMTVIKLNLETEVDLG